MLNLAEPHVLSLAPYVAGKAIEAKGSIASWAKLGSNENCLGPSPSVMRAIMASLSESHLYPNGMRANVVAKICDHYARFKVEPKNVALGNGSSDLIINLTRGLVARSETVLYGWPTFVMYQVVAQAQERRSIEVPLTEDFGFDLERMAEVACEQDNRVKIIFLPNPNNPTGQYLSKNVLESFIGRLPDDVVLVLDEAYFEYATEEDFPNGLNYALVRPRTVVLRTFSKVHAMAGMRLGYAIGDERIIDILCRIRDPFNVNCLAQHAAIAALTDNEHLLKSIEHNEVYRAQLRAGLSEAGFHVLSSAGNFICAKPAPFMPNVPKLCHALLQKGVIIRDLSTFGMPEHVRISVGTERELSQFFNGLTEVLRAH